MKRLYDTLVGCRKEEEIKAEFCKFFKMKLNALGSIDHYTEGIIFEFKFGRNLHSPATKAHILAQVMYYERRLKFSGDLTRYPLPPYICIVDRNEAFFAETKNYAKFYASNSKRYDWDRAPSMPCPHLVADILAFPLTKEIHIYDLANEKEEAQFIKNCHERLKVQLTFFDLLDKKDINEENFLDVFDYWDMLFGDYVRNSRKSSEYFFADIEVGKSMIAEGGQVLFHVEGVEGFIPKTLQMSNYHHFWQNYEKVLPPGMIRIRQKADRLTEDFRRRFTGEFYTPIDFASKGLKYLERTVGCEWWKTGEYRFWDMAAGTGNLEFPLPSSALPYCYISTLEKTDAEYCQKIFPAATCFQYDYLADDIPQLAGQFTFGTKTKMPPTLVADLANPKIKWIIFINPPFATANKAGGETGKTSKDNVSMTTIHDWMAQENYGEASRELFTQFLFRISKEFKGKEAHLCLFSKLKYINSNNDQKIRDGFFKYAYERGFIFPISCFYGATGNFPVGFLIWNLAQCKDLMKQTIRLDVFNENAEKIGVKRLRSAGRASMLNKWCPRPKWDGKSIMPTLSSGIKVMDTNKDKRNHIAPGFLCSLSSKGDDFENQKSVFILSAPYANAGAFSVTAENFEKAMVLHAVKKIPNATWTNDRDAFYAPKKPLSEDFIWDCIVWSAFADSNNCTALRNIQCNGRIWQIPNNLYPFLLKEIRTWPCAHSGLASQFTSANEDRFLAIWLAERSLSKESVAVMTAAKGLFKAFYSQVLDTHWLKYKIETWDAGYYQIRQALKDAQLAVKEQESLKEAHSALQCKLLPEIYKLGFLYPDVEYFK